MLVCCECDLNLLNYSVWVALNAEAPTLGLTLQHYYPSRADVNKTWKVSSDWEMTGQMPFGTKTGEPVIKSFRDNTELVRSYG